jgi:hypothetical protein
MHKALGLIPITKRGEEGLRERERERIVKCPIS